MANTVAATVDQVSSFVRLQIQFDPTVTGVQVQRQDPDGWTDVIRAGSTVTLSGGFAVVYDYEAPLDVPVSYVVTQVVPASGTPAKATSAVVTVKSFGYTWLKDPGLPSRNVRLEEVGGIAEVTRPARSGVFHIIGRSHPVVISARREGQQGDFVFTTATDAQRQDIVDLVSRGTVLLLQTPAGYSVGSVYIHVDDVTETRLTGVGTETSRRWTLPFTEVDRPTGLATAPLGTTWAVVKATYQDWQALKDTQMAWYEVLEGEG